jgi:hypothetical protein
MFGCLPAFGGGLRYNLFIHPQISSAICDRQRAGRNPKPSSAGIQDVAGARRIMTISECHWQWLETERPNPSM